MASVSVNREAYKIVKDLIDNADLYRVKVYELPSGATVIDTGLEAEGGYEAGARLTEVCMGGLGKSTISFAQYGDLTLPVNVIVTDHPAVSLLGSQLAGWTIKVEDFFGMASGPARALALKPKSVFEKIGYRDEADVAVVVIETSKRPTDAVAEYISKECGVDVRNLYILLTTTTSIAGSTQIAGRIVETGLYRLDFLGLDPKCVISGVGYAPIMPLHPDSGKMLAREEDSLIYGGITNFTIDFDDDGKLKELVEKAPATTSKFYGKTSYETLKSVNFDWSKLDPAFFAPGFISVTNKKTGATYEAGRVDPEMLKESLKP